MNPLLDSFLQEARENLKFIEQNLESLEEGDEEILGAIFRAAHTLKGGSGIVGFESVKIITHKAEDLLDQLRSKKLTFQEGMLDALYNAFDEVLNLVESAEARGDVVTADEAALGRIVRYLDQVMGIDTDATSVKSFVLPEAFVSTREKILQFESLDFSKCTHPLQEKIEIGSENLGDTRAYALFFDLDVSCMAFGNDPLYALSLLGEKVKSLVTSIAAQDAKKLLDESLAEEEALAYHLKMTALIEASFEEIEEALYNFMDDINIYPLCSGDVIAFASKPVKNQTATVQKKLSETMLKTILSQQCEQLRGIADTENTLRVKAIAKRCFEAFGRPFAPHNDSAEAILEAIEGKKVSLAAPQIAPVARMAEVIKETLHAAAQAPIHKVQEPKEQESKESKKEVIGKVVKVDQAAIDQLMSVVGELLVAKNSLPYLAESALGQESETTKRQILEKYSFIDRLTSQLQDLTMSMRMLPISYVFDRYPKLVREISKKLDKKVKLTQEGGETKLDKNMIEMLADPLIHIIRNSLDHGIEAPSVRIANGKDESGEIKMKAYPQSDRVIIEIVDDGKGIDSQMVVNKVLEKGLLDSSKIDGMSENEKLNLIMLPGLSTAESISEYSGRGVGMDVVKKSIESFGGSIHLESTVGRGTKITLSIPVSLAVTTLLHVSMRDMHYGFPMDSVCETVKISKKSITCLNNEYYIYLRGEIIPLVVVGEMIDMKALDTESIALVVLDVKGSRIAVVVNALLGQLSVVQKPLQGLLANHSLIGGTALLGNGQIMMILDPISLWEVSDVLGTGAALEPIVA